MLRKKTFSKIYNKKKSKKNNFKKILVVILFLTSLICVVVIIFSFILYFKTIDVRSTIAIKKISILKNETTIPSELITKKFLEEKVTMFDLYNAKNKIIKMFPEIKNIEFKFRSFKNYSVEIKKQKPVFIIHNNKRETFYSSDGTKFWIYDMSQFDSANLIELIKEKFISTNFLVNLYNYFTETGKNNLIKKIYFKRNNEIIIETISGNKIIVDDHLLKIDPKLFVKTFDIAEEENVDIYARDLAAGKLYAKTQK